jgi:hypothetical protein
VYAHVSSIHSTPFMTLDGIDPQHTLHTFCRGASPWSSRQDQAIAGVRSAAVLVLAREGKVQGVPVLARCKYYQTSTLF